MKWIYKNTYPNWKIYIWKDLTGSFGYFGSVNSDLLEKDFSEEEKRIFTFTREILWQSDDALDGEVNQKEVEFIRLFQSNNPDIWYNRWPKFLRNE